MTDNNNQTNIANPDLWIRLIYMVLFGLLSWLARVVVLIIAAVQFLLVMLAGSDNSNLRRLGDGIAQWTLQTFRFLTFASEQKPYPFQDWPAPADNVTAAEQAMTAETTASSSTAEDKGADNGTTGDGKPGGG